MSTSVEPNETEALLRKQNDLSTTASIEENILTNKERLQKTMTTLLKEPNMMKLKKPLNL